MLTLASWVKKLELLSATPRATLTHLSCSPNFPRASYLDERTADVWTNCFVTFSTRWKIFFCYIKEFAHAFSCTYIELELELFSAAPRATLTHFSRSPNFPLASITRYPHAKHEQILKYSRWLTQKRKFSLGLDSKNFLKSSLLPTLVLYLRLK